MENIANVTVHIANKIKAAGGDVNRETLNVIKTKDGKNFYKADEENYFRMYKFVEDSVSYETVEDPVQMYHTGHAFGKFQRMLDDYPADKLYETIVKFHDTPERVNQLKEAIERYIKYYNEKRIKEKLGWMSPIQYRLNTLAA